MLYKKSSVFLKRRINQGKICLSKLFNFLNITVQYDKEKLFGLKVKKYSKEMLCPDVNLSWGETTFKLLGINFDVDLENIVNINFNDKITQIKNIRNIG